MHRQPLLDLLDRYAELHTGERAVAERIASLVRSRNDCFERTCRPGHITGSAWVLSADRRRYLLVHHRKLGRWLQPGGHADGQADVAAVALREAAEESGLGCLTLINASPVGDDAALNTTAPLPLDIDVHQIPARYDAAGDLIEDAHEHHDLRYLLAATADDPLVVSDESHDVRWFTAQEIERVTQEESVLRMLRKSALHDE